MKKFKRMLAGLACVLAVCLCTPTAFAAKVIIYFDCLLYTYDAADD